MTVEWSEDTYSPCICIKHAHQKLFFFSDKSAVEFYRRAREWAENRINWYRAFCHSSSNSIHGFRSIEKFFNLFESMIFFSFFIFSLRRNSTYIQLTNIQWKNFLLRSSSDFECKISSPKSTVVFQLFGQPCENMRGRFQLHEIWMKKNHTNCTSIVRFTINGLSLIALDRLFVVHMFEWNIFM